MIDIISKNMYIHSKRKSFRLYLDFFEDLMKYHYKAFEEGYQDRLAFAWFIDFHTWLPDNPDDIIFQVI